MQERDGGHQRQRHATTAAAEMFEEHQGSVSGGYERMDETSRQRRKSRSGVTSLGLKPPQQNRDCTDPPAAAGIVS